MKLLNNKTLLLLFILWSLLVNFSFGYAVRPGYAVALALILIVMAKFSPVAAKITLAIVTVIAAVYLPVAVKYGPPSLNTVAAARYTSLSESAEFLGMLPAGSIILSFVLFLIAILCMFIAKQAKHIKSRLATIYIALTVAVISFNPAHSYIKHGDISQADIKFSPYRFVYDIYRPYKIITQQEKISASLLATPDTWQPTPQTSPYDTFILVIGESVRRDYMNAYGFSLNNTPFMSQANGILFDHYHSASFATVPSLVASFYLAQDGHVEYNNSFIRLAKKAGYKTFWLSNQGRFGLYDGPVADVGKQADISQFVKKGDSNDHNYYPDNALLPTIQDALSDRAPQKLIVIHLIGSHPESCARTDGHYDEFYISKDISCYVQSIKNTDTMLHEIQKMADRGKNRWSMLYFADHGLGQFNKGEDDAYMEHSDLYKQSFNVPLFITSYDASEQRHIAEERSGLDFLNLFADWLGIHDEKIASQCRPLADRPCIKQVNVLNKDFSLITLDSLDDDDPL